VNQKMIKNKCDWCDQYLIIKEVEKSFKI